MSILWDEGCVVVMRCLYVHSVGGYRCVWFLCVVWVSILWDEGCVVVM